MKKRKHLKRTPASAEGRFSPSSGVATRPPEPRHCFHTERVPCPSGDRQIQIVLAQDGAMGYFLSGRVRSAGKREASEVARRQLDLASAPDIPDARRYLGAPPWLDPQIFRSLLLECRRIALRPEDPGDSRAASGS